MAPPVPPQPPELPLVVRVYCAQSPTIAASAWAFLPRFEHRSFLPARSCRRSAITCRRGYDWQRTRQMALPFPITLPTDYWYSSARRSEEHTSELQSLMRISYAVFCLKKKKTE